MVNNLVSGGNEIVSGENELVRDSMTVNTRIYSLVITS